MNTNIISNAISCITAPYKEFMRKRNQRVAYTKIKQGLMDNPLLLIDTQRKFENVFGKDSKTRSIKQWVNLVRVYGVEVVCEKEQLTEREVNLKCTESFSIKLKREIKQASAK